MSTSKKAKAPKAAKAVKKSSPEPHHPIAKRYIFIALGVVVVISLIFIWYSATQNSTTLDETEDLPSYEELSTNDTDGDGIEDWRELLLGTSPTAFDTNGDGVGDNTIARTTDNIVTLIQLQRLRQEYPEKSEDDLREILIEQTDSEGDLLKISKTDRIAQDIYLNATILEKTGQLTPELESAITDEYVQDLIYNYVYPLRSEPEFLILSAYDPYESAVYVESMLDILNIDILDPDPMVFFEDYLNSRNTELLKKALDQNLQKITSGIVTMSSMPVPSYFATEHTELVNSYIRLAIDLSEIQLYEEDALAGYTALMRYHPNLFNLSEATEAFKQAVIRYADDFISNTPNE